jgi:hypothetical protein
MERFCTGACRVPPRARYSGMSVALDVQRERIRAMTADEKVRIAHALWVETRDVLESGVRARNPGLNDEQVANRVRELMSASRS